MIIEDSKGNRAAVQENRLIDITPQGKSTLTFDLGEVIESLMQTGKYECWDDREV